MAIELATGYVSLLPSAKGFAAATAAELGGPLASVGAKSGDDVSKAFGARFATGMKVAAAAGAAAIAAVPVGLFKVGRSFDEAFDTIRVGTGATGDALKALGGDFKSVVQNVPADFGAAATAIADLNTRTGATGPALQELSKRMLEMTRLTGGDLTANIASTTRLFGDWGIASEAQADTLDKLFRASQATGVGIDALSQNMVKFGAPLRQLGFGFDQAVGLLAKFEKEGVNTELVMGSMRIALGKMARGGEPAQATLQRITEDIKNAGDVSKANALALDLFGARAGPDMAAAIREGRFELGDLMATIATGGETILGAAADTEDFAEKWTKLKNRVFVAIQPIASKFFDLIGKGMDHLPGVFDAVGRAARPLVLGVSALFAAFREGDVTSDGFVGIMERVGVAFRTVLGQARLFFNALRTGFTEDEGTPIERLALTLRSFGEFIRRNIRPILASLGVLVATVVVPPFVAWAAATLTAIAPFVALAAAVVGAIALFNRFPIIGETVRRVLDAMGRHVQEAVAFVREIWPQISEGLSHAVNVMEGVIRTFVDVVMAMWRAWGDDLFAIAKRLFDGVRETISNALQVITGVIRTVLAVINGDWGKAWDGLRSVVGGVWDQIKNIVSTAAAVLKSVVGGVASTFAEVFRPLGNLLHTWVVQPFETLVGFVTGLPKRIAVAAAGMFDGIREAFKSAVNWIIRAWNRLEFKIPGFDPPGPGPKFGGFTLGVPNIPEFHTGGVVPGRPGEEVLIKALAGETVLPPGEAPSPARASAGGFAPTLNVSVLHEEETPAEIQRSLRTAAYLLGV